MLTIGILNNMPESAVRSTERQFTDLLREAADGIPLDVRWYSFKAREDYGSLDDLLRSRHLDGLIVTGNEPKLARLPDEAYWPDFVRVVDWATTHTTSAVWSCLAAHGAVLHLDGIERVPYNAKLHGLFLVARMREHPLLDRLPPVWHVPHSRWNQVPIAPLRKNGYQVLSASPEVGADGFAKQVADSLFVFWQGHIEYDARALVREYRRDVLRFVSKESTRYPEIPQHYFEAGIEQELLDLREQAKDGVNVMTALQTLIGRSNPNLIATWHTIGMRLYRNWFTMLRINNRNENWLFPTQEARDEIDNDLTQVLSKARGRTQQGSVVPTLDSNRFAAELEDFNFKRAMPVEDVIDWTVRQLEHGLTHVTHPRYFGLFNPTPTFPAQLADRIAAVFNPQLATETTSPVAVAIERHVIKAVAARLGLPSYASGHFTTGGAEANYTGLLLALMHACPQFAEHGVHAFRSIPTIYISQDSHLAWIKIARQCGIGHAAVRLIPTAHGRMDLSRLISQIETDIATDRQPIMIVATAGTTNAGMIDPIHGCRILADQYGMWLHVDAAWGGAAIASERVRSCLDGIEAADSVTVDAHKWFAVTMGCGMFLTRHPNLLGETFNVATSYMPSQRATEPYVTSLQWSRRFLGLRLFLSLAVAGWQGYGAHIERTLELAQLLQDRLAANDWTVVNKSPLGVVCIEPRDRSADEIVRDVLASSRAWVSTAYFEGQQVIRACVTSGETTENDINILLECLETARWIR